MIDAEPAWAVVLSAEAFDAAFEAIANFVDLKSAYLLGHARAVADLAAAAGARSGVTAADVRGLRRAGLVHGFGRLGVSNSIWDKHGLLGAGEWERVRLHPHLTERMLRQSEALAPLGAIAVQVRARASTARATRARCPAPRSRRGVASSAWPTPTRRCSSRARTDHRAHPSRQRPSCGSMPGAAASTRTPSKPFSARRVIASRGAAIGRPD